MNIYKLNFAETWDEVEDYWQYNSGWGMCNAASGANTVCRLGGIGCNVDHTYVKIRNLEQRIFDLETTIGE